MLDPELPRADLDVAVYLEPADVREFVKGSDFRSLRDSPRGLATEHYADESL